MDRKEIIKIKVLIRGANCLFRLRVAPPVGAREEKVERKEDGEKEKGREREEFRKRDINNNQKGGEGRRKRKRYQD